MDSKEIFNWLNDLPQKSIGTYPLTFEQIRNLNNYLNEKIIGKKEYKDYLFVNNNNNCRKKTKIEGSSSISTNEQENKIEYNTCEIGKVCGYTFKPGDTIYRCCDCGFDETCVLCSKCFNASNHTGHNIKFNITKYGGGCCDCGDEEAFVVDINCKYHNVKVVDENLKPLPEQLKVSIRNVISQCFDFIVDTLSKSPEIIKVPENVNDVRKEEKQDSSSKLYCCLLWNDEKHSFNTVIKQLKEAIKCSREKAENISKNVDVHGRECICISDNLNELKTISDIINRVELRTTIRLLTETIKEEIVSFLIIYFSKLLKNVPGIISINGIKYESVKDTIRKIINEEFFKKITNTENFEIPFYLDESDILRIDLLFYYDIRLWKSTRVLIKELYVNTLIADQESKTKTACRYFLHYPYFIYSYINDIEDTNNIVNFIIQTISPSSVNYLFNETKFFDDLLCMIKAHILCNSKYENYDYSNFLKCYLMAKEQKSSEFNAVSLTTKSKLSKGTDILGKMVEGVIYLLQAPVVQSQSFRKNPHYLQSIMETIVYIQSFNPQKCYLDVHIPTESPLWVFAAEYAFFFGRMIKCVSDCYKYCEDQKNNLLYAKAALTNIIVYIDEWCRKRNIIELSNAKKETKFISYVKDNNNNTVFRVTVNLDESENNGQGNSSSSSSINENSINTDIKISSEKITDNSSLEKIKSKKGFHNVISLDGKTYEVPHYSVLTNEISFLYPLHWLFISCARKLPEILRNLTKEEFETYDIKNIWNDIFSFTPLTNMESDLTMENRVLRLMDYPLRCLAVLSQINSNIWIKNGQTIYQMASMYSNFRMNTISYESNIIFLQIAILILPGDLFLTSLLDRFGIMEWFKGRPLTNSKMEKYDYEKINILVTEFLMILIKLLTFRLDINGKGFEENLRSDIIHILIKKPMTFSEIAKKVEKKYADLEKDITKNIEKILNEVSTFKFPDGIADRGMYELKTQFYDEVDPWHYSLTCNERESATKLIKNQILKTRNESNLTIDNIDLKPRMEPIIPTSSFSKLPNLCNSIIFIHIVFKAIWNSTKLETENDDEITDETPIKLQDLLDNAIYLAEIAIEEEKRNKQTKLYISNDESSFILNSSKVIFTIPSSSMDSKIKISYDDNDNSNINNKNQNENDMENNMNINESENDNKMKESENDETEIKTESQSENKDKSMENDSKEYIKLTLIDWIIYVIEKSISTLKSSNIIPRFVTILKDIEANTSDEKAKEKISKWVEQKYQREHKQSLLEEKEKEEARIKKQKAKERRAQIMAQLRKQQNSFIQSASFDFDDDEFNDDMANTMDENSDNQKNIYQFPTGSCIMCRESEETEDNIIGLLGYAQTSTHVRHIKLNETNDVYNNLQMDISLDHEQERSSGNTVEKSKEISVLPPVNTLSYKPGIFISSCGHMMHMKCLEEYIASIDRIQQMNPQRNFAVNVKKNEYLCPFCKNLCNMLIPVVWKDKQFTIKKCSIDTEKKENNEKEDNDLINNYSSWLSKVSESMYSSDKSNKNNTIFKSIEEFSSACENSLIENIDRNQNKNYFEIKSNINIDTLKQVFDKKIVESLKYIKTVLLYESVKTIKDTDVNVDLLHEVFTSTIQTFEVMMRGAKQYSSSESTVIYPFIGIIEHANPKTLDILRTLSETILTFMGIQIHKDSMFKIEYLMHAKEIAQMIFGKTNTNEKKQEKNKAIESIDDERKLSSDDSEYFSANMDFNDDEDDDDESYMDFSNSDEDVEMTANDEAQQCENERMENRNDENDNNSNADEDIDGSIDLDTDQENRDIMEENREEQEEQEQEQEQEQGQIIQNMNGNFINFEVVNDEDLVVEDFFDDDDDDDENEDYEFFDEGILSLFGNSTKKSKDEKVEIKLKKLLCPIQEDTFSLFVSSAMYIIDNNEEVSNWTFLFYSLEIVKCLLGIAESVGIFGDEWPISPKIKKLMNNLNDSSAEIKKSIEKGKEKESAEDENKISYEDFNKNININNSKSKDEQPISCLLYKLLEIMKAQSEVINRCKKYLTESILNSALRAFTITFLRQSVLLVYAKFFVQPDSAEVNPDLNEYERSLNFLGLPSSISKTCLFIIDSKEMINIIMNWCKQWLNYLKVNPFENVKDINKNNSEVVNIKKRERKSEVDKVNISNSAASSSMKLPVVINDSALSTSNANTTVISTSIENVASMNGDISVNIDKKHQKSTICNKHDLYKIKLQSPAIIEMFPLSNKISDLIEECAHRKCSQCNTVPNIQAICLLCGEMICFQSFCCIKNDYGECYCHTQRCGKGIGMYIIIKKCIVYINCEKNGSFLNAPYLDIHGEPDESFLRGKPQFLSPRRYDELRRMWLNKTIPSYIAQRLENTNDYGGWETL